jgi:DNA-binding NarL/FixJ family response regulator
LSIRVLLADDHAVLRAGLRLLISGQEDMDVVGEAADGPEVLGLLPSLHPDVVVLDITMPRTDAFAIIAAIVRSSARCVVLSMHDDPAYAASAFAAGAAAYVAKKSADVELLAAIRATAAGRSAPRPIAVRGGSAPALSARETVVLRTLAQGHTNREVAGFLGVSVKTAETFRARMRDKLGLQSRADIVRHALEAGILTSDPPAPRPSRRR